MTASPRFRVRVPRWLLASLRAGWTMPYGGPDWSPHRLVSVVVVNFASLGYPSPLHTRYPRPSSPSYPLYPTPMPVIPRVVCISVMCCFCVPLRFALSPRTRLAPYAPPISSRACYLCVSILGSPSRLTDTCRYIVFVYLYSNTSPPPVGEFANV